MQRVPADEEVLTPQSPSVVSPSGLKGKSSLAILSLTTASM